MKASNKTLFVYPIIIGTVLGLIVCILFGVFDVQCQSSPLGKNWNAEQQRCEP